MLLLLLLRRCLRGGSNPPNHALAVARLLADHLHPGGRRDLRGVGGGVHLDLGVVLGALLAAAAGVGHVGRCAVRPRRVLRLRVCSERRRALAHGARLHHLHLLSLQQQLLLSLPAKEKLLLLLQRQIVEVHAHGVLHATLQPLLLGFQFGSVRHGKRVAPAAHPCCGARVCAAGPGRVRLLQQGLQVNLRESGLVVAQGSVVHTPCGTTCCDSVELLLGLLLRVHLQMCGRRVL
mmetsp:Transcript_2535/g.5066  ORF Transcript_2535/g.5066 Transcript_2535/m.5066 type:complete len:235 (+) Transcript_2535:2337-3041(+)